jgi:2-polyprenyl-3-methyl-5-hydroxy-6-metoxy-1,4-benzoquinol methylase
MQPTTEERALPSLGVSHVAIYELVARVVAGMGVKGGSLLDVGCGRGQLWPFVATYFVRYAGVDIVRHESFPQERFFTTVDLEKEEIPLPAESHDVVAAVETIEHLENPRRFFRAMTGLIKPGGWLIVTTPNQLNLTSLLFLALKGEFPYFQEAPGLYPAHLSALLPIDLSRMAREQGLIEPRIYYTDCGRIPLTTRHWPWPLKGRWFSDNVLLTARRPPVPCEGAHLP